MRAKPYLLLLIILISSCSDDLTEDKFDSKELTGIWVPFEIIHNGIVETGPFTSSSIFGVYAESLKLDDNNKYYPVSWTNKDEYVVKFNEIGDYEFVKSNNNLLLTSGPWDMEFTVIKMTSAEVWISSDFGLYKLKREPATY
ncbi:MAG: hypothetical protein ACOYXT_29075 [Bacteroidota bacterium]